MRTECSDSEAALTRPPTRDKTVTGTRLGDLKNKQSTHTSGRGITGGGAGYAAILAREELCTVRNSAR